MKFIKINTAFILSHKDGRILLQHRDANAPRNPNKWCIFGGGIKEGEKPEQAAVRESKEELGIDIEIKDLKFFKSFEIDQRKYFVFTTPLKWSVDRLREQQTEGDDLGLFSEEEIKDLDMTKGSQTVLREFFKK